MSFFIPSVVKDDSVSLRLGHAPALNVHRTFIHYRRAASLPCNKGRLGRFLLTLSLIMKFTLRSASPDC